MLVKETINSLLHFIFPSHCIHCQQEVVGCDLLFCHSCREWIELFPEQRCFPYKAVAVEKEGIVLSLIRESTGSMQQEVLSTMAALMAFQIHKLQWPLPNRILYSPEDPRNKSLALILSSWFDIPCYNWIQSQERWNPGNCSDQILLVLDVFLSFSTSWDLLQEGNPSQIFMIGFCLKDP